MKTSPSTILGRFLFLTAVVLSLSGCGRAPQNPINELRLALQGVPTYSIVLSDMKTEGTFFTEYFHKYKIVMAGGQEGARDTDWLPVPENLYKLMEPFLGLSVYTRKDGKETAAIGPPGYEYVGDSRYGQWWTDQAGRNYWDFHPNYFLLGYLLGGQRVYRDHYDTYTTYRTSQRPYYGPNREYGTGGTITRKTSPEFFTRRMSRATASKTSFSQSVGSRIGRTSVGTRSRSTRSGK